MGPVIGQRGPPQLGKEGLLLGKEWLLLGKEGLLLGKEGPRTDLLNALYRVRREGSGTCAWPLFAHLDKDLNLMFLKSALNMHNSCQNAIFKPNGLIGQSITLKLWPEYHCDLSV